MTAHQIVYLVFGIVLVIALGFDLGLLSKKNKEITIRQAMYQTFFWVGLALLFFVFLWMSGSLLEAEKSPTKLAGSFSQTALEFLSAYLMEWSLSIDNIFVFILIFNAFSVKPKNYPRVLLIGILMAIVFRIIFITAGIVLVQKFEWILYGFGAFLLYTGYKMFTANDDAEFDPKKSKVFRLPAKYPSPGRP